MSDFWKMDVQGNSLKPSYINDGTVAQGMLQGATAVLQQDWGKQTQPSALDYQIGGSHYKSKPIQPIEYIAANHLNFCEGSVVKYITRWRQKGGVKDLEKIKHYVDLLIEMETKYGALPTGI